MKTILLLEDHEILSKLYAVSLREAGYNVIVTEKGEEAIRIVQNRSIDLVVSELHLSDMEGVEVLGKILQVRPSLRCIINSREPINQSDFRFWAADEYICKTSGITMLIEKIREVLNK